jgi:integrase
MKVHIRQAKGKKDRYVTLPQLNLEPLRGYWATHRNAKLLFPRGRTPGECQQAKTFVDRCGLQKSFKVIAQDVGIYKAVTLHGLRHCSGMLLTGGGSVCAQFSRRWAMSILRSRAHAHRLLGSCAAQICRGQSGDAGTEERRQGHQGGRGAEQDPQTLRNREAH